MDLEPSRAVAKGRGLVGGRGAARPGQGGHSSVQEGGRPPACLPEEAHAQNREVHVYFLAPQQLTSGWQWDTRGGPQGNWRVDMLHRGPQLRISNSFSEV